MAVILRLHMAALEYTGGSSKLQSIPTPTHHRYLLIGLIQTTDPLLIQSLWLWQQPWAGWGYMFCTQVKIDGSYRRRGYGKKTMRARFSCWTNEESFLPEHLKGRKLYVEILNSRVCLYNSVKRVGSSHWYIYHNLVGCVYSKTSSFIHLDLDRFQKSPSLNKHPEDLTI